VVWVERRQGQLELLGGLTPQATDSILPLTGRLFVCAPQPCELAVLDTATCLRRGLAWAGLALLHTLAYRALQTQLAQQALAERARIETISAIDQQAMSRSLRQLATVLSPAAATPARAEEANQLIAACRVVGAASGIIIQKPAPAAGGATLRTPLDAIAQASHVRVRRVALRGDWWRRDNGPLLASMAADKRPVALLIGVRPPYQLYDPGTGTTRPLNAELAAELEPFAHTFFRALPARAITPFEVLRFGMRGCERDLTNVLLMSAGLGLLGLAAPIVTGVIIDSVIPAANGFKLLQLTLALVVAAFATALFQVVQRTALLRVEARANTATQAAVWDRLLNMPVPFFRQYSAGDLATRVAGIDAIRQTLTGLTVSTLLSGLFALLNLGLLFASEPRLALIALGLVLLTCAITTAAGYVSLRYTRELSRMRTRLAGLVLQFVTGIARLRVAGAERRAFAVWAEQFAAQRRVAFQARTISIGLGVFNSAYPTIALAVIFAALASNPDGTRTTGSVLAFVAAFGGMLSAALGVSGSALAVLQVVPLVENARPIFDTLPEVDPQRADPGVLRGGIKVDRVTFRYQPDTAPILNDVSIEALPGEFVAIVGPSGSGKSTLLRMLLGFERPEAGAVYYDDKDLAGLDLQAVRRQIGVVLQSGKLMPGDIFSNIVGSALLSLDDAWEAAERAGLANDIRQMPMGMQTVIGEGGSTFSGGQRQRLMIARAIVNRPRILFFDEATSALDNRTQLLVSKSLDLLRATRIVIAHRLSTIMNADRIYVMVNGAVVQCGIFAELSALEGPFRDLVRRQLV
jgi:ATP-binding cassette subfamily C protein